MSEWVVLDISSMTKSTKTERVLKILKDVSLNILNNLNITIILLKAKIDVVKITDIYPSEQRNKPVISMTVRRAHYEDENKTPDWPGNIDIQHGKEFIGNVRILDH